MSERPHRHIRAQASICDPNVMSFVLETPVQEGRSGRLQRTDDTPLARALFAITGVIRVEVAEATILVQKDTGADWALLKRTLAAAIRRVLDNTDPPLGNVKAEGEADADILLLRGVEELLERQVNPAVAAHGGHIAADRVEGSTVYLRMSGGCQGCAASSATLQQGVERMLRAALPQIREIVDVTDHAAGSKPFYVRDDGPSPVLNHPAPPGAIGLEGGQITVDPDYLAPRLGLTPAALREGLRTGAVVGVTETGQGADAGKTRTVLRSATHAWAAEILSDGSAREIPPPPEIGSAADRERDLADRVRAHLAGLSVDDTPLTYGALARALGFWVPGSVRRVTRALEITMREDAANGRPFIAARTVSRGRDGLPGKGFYELATVLCRGPKENETERDFHRRETRELDEALSCVDGARLAMIAGDV